jgi:lipid-binding SYLF domain-containing protein
MRQSQYPAKGELNMIGRTLAVLMLYILIGLGPASTALAASKDEIDAKVQEALANFYKQTSAGKQLAQKAAGMLVFPEVLKAGVGIGGEYGEGALLTKGKTVGYYNTAAASIGFQLGAQVNSQIILFMNQKVLDSFRKSQGWKAGVDGSVALATLGAGGELSTETMQQPIIGFIFSNKGLMYNLTFEGSKISRLER